MKKRLFLSLVTMLIILSGCSDNNENNVTYLDNKLIEGTWHSELKSIDEKYSIDSTVFHFVNNEAYSLYYSKIAGLDTLKFEGKTKYGRYLVTDSIIDFPNAPYENGLKLRYRLKKGVIDTLFLYTPEHSSWSKYTRINK